MLYKVRFIKKAELVIEAEADGDLIKALVGLPTRELDEMMGGPEWHIDGMTEGPLRRPDMILKAGPVFVHPDDV